MVVESRARVVDPDALIVVKANQGVQGSEEGMGEGVRRRGRCWDSRHLDGLD